MKHMKAGMSSRSKCRGAGTAGGPARTRWLRVLRVSACFLMNVIFVVD